ncbi:vomeronasal type-1 receptor 4-like [Ctenodactylus gundi]
MGTIFLSQSVLGILGNVSLLHYYLFQSHSTNRLRSTALIFTHLLIANCLVIFSKGLPQTIVAFGLKHFLSDFTCRFILYIQRVGRSVSIGTTCFLSVYQTVMISPMNSRWKDLKVKVPQYTGFSILLCWTLHIIINLIFPVYDLYVSMKWSTRNITAIRDMGYCSVVEHTAAMGSVYTALVIFPEVSLFVLTTWCSGSMIFILYRHKQRVQHIHSSNVPRRSPEARATHSILLLVSTFLSFYMLTSLFHISVAFLSNLSLGLVRTSEVLSVCFPTVSPFLLMSQDSSISRTCFVWIKNAKLTIVTRHM